MGLASIFKQTLRFIVWGHMSASVRPIVEPLFQKDSAVRITHCCHETLAECRMSS